VSASDLLEQFTLRNNAQSRRRHTWGRRPRRVTHAATAQTLMSWPAITVTPETSVAEAAHVARVEHLHFMPVVTNGVLVGCVTTADLNKAYTRSDDAIREDSGRSDSAGVV
jgi:predicted transcriptional regulator